MGIAADLQCQARGKAGIGLTQIHLLRQNNQLRPSPLVKPGVGRVDNRLLNDGRIDRHTLPSLMTPDLRPASMVWVSSHSTPIRLRQRVSEDGSMGRLKEGLTSEMLVVTVLNPAGDNRLI